MYSAGMQADVVWAGRHSLRKSKSTSSGPYSVHRPCPRHVQEKGELTIYSSFRWLLKIYSHIRYNCLYTNHLVESLIKYLVCNIILIYVVFPFLVTRNVYIAPAQLRALPTRLGRTLIFLSQTQYEKKLGSLYEFFVAFSFFASQSRIQYEKNQHKFIQIVTKIKGAKNSLRARNPPRCISCDRQRR